MLVMKNGKTNKSGLLEVGSCIRNVDVRVCPFMMLGMYLFQLYHVENQPFPDFTTSRHWYFTKLLQSDARDPTKAWSYSSHYYAMETAMKACNMYSTEKTHMARGAGARMCDLAGVSDSNTRRLGRWNSDSMSSAYVTGIPREAMRTMGGF